MNHNNLLTNYWCYVQFGGKGLKKKWATLEHNGVLFPPEYVPHNIPVMYDSHEVKLEPKAEEYITLYAKYMETEYTKNKIFNNNFWKDFKKVLGKDHEIKSLDGCNLDAIHKHLIKEREKKKQTKKEETKEAKEEDKYKVAMMDGKEQPVGNFRVEPPGIFIGRGCSPKLGMIKERIFPEDIIINVGKEAKVPPPPEGHEWKKVIHDRTVEWLASWKDNITGKIKYVWLGAHSELKSKNDIAKFDLARKLKKKIKKIREENEKFMDSDEKYTKQIATALYFIDKFALRVGNEKGEDETDTVGVTSLRVEHIQLLENNKIKLDFLGKDSVRFNRTIVVDDIVYNNVKEFMTDKTKYDQLFDIINSNDINKYLQSFMKNLTAKVYRTCNASTLFQKELKKITNKFETYDEADKINILLDEFNKANAKVALLCNHQKNINKSSTTQLENLNKSINNYKSKLRKAQQATTKNPETIKKLQSKLKKLKAKKILKIELKNISLGTSKTNYIDPRIGVAFMKKHGLPIDKIFTKTLQEKFKWAMSIDDDFKF